MATTAEPSSLRSGRVEIGTRCNVYRNLNLLKSGVVGWSVQVRVDRKRMLVMQHARCVLLSNVEFKHASPAQSQKCKEGVRQVCAWIKGTYQGSCISAVDMDEIGTWKAPPVIVGSDLMHWRRLRCDPKTGRGDFHDDETKQRVDKAAYAFVDAAGKAWYMPEEPDDSTVRTSEE